MTMAVAAASVLMPGVGLCVCGVKTMQPKDWGVMQRWPEVQQ